MSKGNKNNKKLYIGIGIALLLLLLIFCLFPNNVMDVIQGKPTLKIITPQKVDSTLNQEVVVDVTISSFGEDIYPAASMSIDFDPARLEFMGIEEGNVFITNGGNEVSYALPKWNCNPEQSNKSGKINVMYLDTTGGRYAFTNELLQKDDNVVFRLKFRIRGSVRKGDVCDLVFDDAIFAASNEKQSLAMSRNTLKVRNGKIVIGE